jgi:transcriptional regulator with XRE-family HTH domain
MHVIIEKQFRDIVQRQLEADGVSRSELARRLGVPPQMVTDYLNGRRAPTGDMIERFFGALGLAPELRCHPVDELVTTER